MLTRLHDLDKDVLIIEASDAINDDDTEGMFERLEEEINAGKHKKIIVDCAALKFLSSFGLSLILRLRKAAMDAGGEVKLASINTKIDQVLRVSRMTPLFLIYADVDQARNAFRIRQRSM
jgi:stage II sporulation protein AA (anti-sigma F factor antagonist)